MAAIATVLRLSYGKNRDVVDPENNPRNLAVSAFKTCFEPDPYSVLFT